MDTRTGQIATLDEFAKHPQPDRKITPLSPAEYQQIAGCPQEERPVELALMRFKMSRQALGAPWNVHISNAFRQGYKAALEDSRGA